MDLNFNASSYQTLSATLSSVEEVLFFVKTSLESNPVTDEVREELLEKLDDAFQQLSSLEKVAGQVNKFALSYFTQLKETAISLYGEVDDSYLQHEVVVLKDETHQLEETMGKKNFEQIAARIAGLKDHLSKILGEFSPALQERRALVAAKLVLEKAEALLRGSQIEDLSLTEWSLLEAEAVLEEIADYLAEENRGAIRMLMRRLTPAQKRLVAAYLEPKDLCAGFLHDVEGAAYQNNWLAG